MTADINRARRRITAACNEMGITRKRDKKNRRATRMAAAIKRGYLSVAEWNRRRAEAERYAKEQDKLTIEILSKGIVDAIDDDIVSAGIPTTKAIAEVSFKPTWRLYAAIGLGIVLVLTLVAYLT